MEDCWACMVGVLAPAAWRVMAFATGIIGAAVRQILRISDTAGMANLISLVAGVTAIFSLLMITACGRYWVREYAGLGKSLITLAVIFGVVVVYYVIVV